MRQVLYYQPVSEAPRPRLVRPDEDALAPNTEPATIHLRLVPVGDAAAAHPAATDRTQGFYSRHGKRWFDLSVTVVVLPFALVLMSGVAVLVRLVLGRGVIYKQCRVGRDGNDFMMYKFRTMRPSRRTEHRPFNGPDRRSTHKTRNDPRHTRLGIVLRKTSLDELPQFFNVIKGDMSLVGPRPELAEVVDQYGCRAHPRHLATPGITGTWQTTVRNEGTLLHECFDSELDYTANIRFSEDLKILLRTVKVLAKPNGA